METQFSFRIVLCFIFYTAVVHYHVMLMMLVVAANVTPEILLLNMLPLFICARASITLSIILYLDGPERHSLSYLVTDTFTAAV